MPALSMPLPHAQSEREPRTSAADNRQHHSGARQAGTGDPATRRPTGGGAVVLSSRAPSRMHRFHKGHARARHGAGEGACAMALRCLLETVFVLALSVSGGIWNHMRGSAGGMFTDKAFTEPCSSTSPGDHMCVDYWIAHAYYRLVMALPTAAVVHLLIAVGRPRTPTLNLWLTIPFLVVTWASLFVGWGCYFNLGWAADRSTGSLVRSGLFDWLLGREQPGWGFHRRWMRKFGGMGLRGLLWTLPPGYVLHWNGYGWQIALSGAAMPLVYMAGMHGSWESHGFHPAENQDWGFTVGAPRSEVLWGTWIWLVLLTSLLAQPGYLRWAPRRMLAFEANALVAGLVFAGSVLFYATIHQKDKQNWLQTVAGAAIPAAYLLFKVALVHIRLRWASRDGDTESLGGASINENSSDEDEDDEGGQLLKHRAGLRRGASSRPLSGSCLEAMWSSEGSAPFRQLRNLTGLVSAACLIMTWAFVIATAAWNINSPRYCRSSPHAHCA